MTAGGTWQKLLYSFHVFAHVISVITIKFDKVHFVVQCFVCMSSGFWYVHLPTKKDPDLWFRGSSLNVWVQHVMVTNHHATGSWKNISTGFTFSKLFLVTFLINLTALILLCLLIDKKRKENKKMNRLFLQMNGTQVAQTIRRFVFFFHEHAL